MSVVHGMVCKFKVPALYRYFIQLVSATLVPVHSSRRPDDKLKSSTTCFNENALCNYFAWWFLHHEELKKFVFLTNTNN